MKYTLSLIILSMLSSIVWGAPTNFSNITKISSPAISPNIIPLITLNDNHQNGEGTSQHEPCAATRLTPTLLLTAAHCVAGGLINGERIQATLFKAKDGTEGLILFKPGNDSLIKANAQVFMYRPHFTNPETIPIPFDFAVVVLDSKLSFNGSLIQNVLRQPFFSKLPQATKNKIKIGMEQKAQEEFFKWDNEYTGFINKKLDSVALLTMTPKGVLEELRGRQLSAYFWNGYQYNSTRDPVRILQQTIKGTGAPRNTHLLLFSGESFHPGTSGSPIFDTQRKLVVSVASGGVSDGSNGGGLIDQNVCQWVKRYDSDVKCLVRHDGVVVDEQETR